ncbi:MAG: UDP-N-acetylglucosamine 1-carboxyvinyltransferase, partial [Bacteroides sp.]|nr:UDP-N-acetylglucosamine 1-carboxyvinyltransferase [Bacteroides sp.]
MASFEIHGGKQLKGEIIPQGAKNEALQILCATLLTPEEVVIENIPEIRDVNKLIELLADFGVKVKRLGEGSWSFQADEIDLDFLYTIDFQKKATQLRGSVMIVGPLLARFGRASIPKPGGDKIGRRRLDTHFIGLEKLGANFHFDNERCFYNIESPGLKGCFMLLEEASVTGTANVVM